LGRTKRCKTRHANEVLSSFNVFFRVGRLLSRALRHSSAPMVPHLHVTVCEGDLVYGFPQGKLLTGLLEYERSTVLCGQHAVA
jgi:hypothetical protein